MIKIADRSVSINLRANVSGFVSGMGQAKRSTEDLSRQMVQTGAYADQFRKRLEAATKALPKIEIDADSSPAEIKFAELRAEMEKLADKKIGIDIDAASAQAQLQEIERELEKLQGQSATIDVKADIGTALAELRAVDAEVSRVNGKDARVQVDANVGPALAGIAMVAAALASLPAVTSIAVGVTALGSAFAAAGIGAAAFGAVAVPSLGRINEALKAQASAAQSAGAATGGAGQSAAQAAQQAMQLEQAEKRLKDAQADAKTAQEDLTRAREAGRRALEDMNFSLDRSILSQKDAALAVKEAAARLDEVNNDSKSSDLDRERAALNYEMALQRAEEQEVKTARARKDTNAANQAGVKGTKEYTSAQDNLKQAQAKVTEATAALKQMQLQQQAAMSGGGGAAGKLRDAFADLSKEEKVLAKDMQAFSKEYLAWQRSLQPDVFPVIAQGLDLMRLGLKEATPLAKSASGALLTLGKDAEQALRGPFWQEFLDDVNKEIPGAITGLGRIGGDVFEGFAGIIQAFLPYTGDVLGQVEKISQGFSDWGTNLKGSPEFHDFIEYAQANGPKVVEIVKNIAEFVGKMASVGGDLGPGVLDFLVTLSEKLAGMEPAQIEAIAKGVGLVFAAVKLGASLKIGALVLLAQVLSEMSPGQIQALALAIGATVLAVKGYQAISGAVGFFQNLSGSIDGAGKSADGAKGKLSNLASLIGKGGVIAAAAAGTVLAVDAVSDALDGLNPNIDELTKQLGAFGKGGEPAAALLDQLDPKMASLTGRFESFADSAARLTSNNSLIAFGNQLSGLIDDNLGVELDGGRQGIDNLDQALSTMVGNGNGDEAAAAFNRLARQALEAGVPMDKLKTLFPEYAQSLDGALPKTADMAVAMGFLGVQVDPLAVAMDRFNTGLDTFNAKTDVAAQTLALKDAFTEAKDAIDKAGGKLEFTSRMTDKQREAVVLARDQFGGYIGKVLEAAKAAGELAGKTGDAALKSNEARDAFLRQLEPLFKLAGSSKEARDRIYDMAAGFGINRTQADRAATGVKGVKDVLAELKSKEVTVSANTEPARKALRDLLNAFIKPVEIPVGIRAPTTPPKKKATGGIDRYAAGGIDYAAAAGMQVRPQPPGVVSKPTVLYGEGSSGAGATEAYIPYEGQFRGRAVELLGQVADDFGFALYGKNAAQQVAQVAVTVADASTQIGAGLGMGTSALTDAFGATGSLTSSITKVGSSADQLNQAWLSGSQIIGDTVGVMGTVTSDAVTVMTDGMTSSIDTLSVSVADLGSVLSAAAEMTSSTSTGGSKAKPGAVDATATKSTAPRKGKAGAVGATAKKTTAARTQGGMIAGSYGLSGTPDWVSSSASALSMGSPVNSSRVSAPQQMPASYSGSGSSGGSGAASAGGGISTTSRGGSLITVENLNVTNRSDADAAAAYLYARLGSKGP